MIVETANKIFSLGTIGLQASLVAFVFYAVFFRKKYDFLSQNGIKLIFLVSLTATSGSLFYSLYAGFSPCDLCWYQRILMYPIAIISFIALLKKDGTIVDYVLALSSIGAIISLYHNYIFYKAINSTFCTLGESCIQKYVLEFGYVTIPLMALTAFLTVIALSLAYKSRNN